MFGGDFDGNAALAGGGFMPSQATTQAPDSSSSLKNRDVRTLLPLTLKQLNSVSTSGESNFSIDGVDINTDAIVGRISKLENRITQVDFVVDDGTGCVECIDGVMNVRKPKKWKQLGMYVRLHGHLKSFQGKRTVNVFAIRPVLTSTRLYTTLPSVSMSTSTTPNHGVLLSLRPLLLLGLKCHIQRHQPLQNLTKPVHLISLGTNTMIQCTASSRQS